MSGIWSWAPALFTASAAATTCVSFIMTILAIRAKSDLHRSIQKAASYDEELAKLIQASRKGHLRELELEEAKAVLKRTTSQLAKRERSVLQEGIEQPSRSGERRFIERLLTAA